MAASLRTPIGILSFPVLFTPRPRAPGGEPVFQCSLLFDQAAQRDPAFAALRRAVAAEIDANNGPGKSQDRAFLAGCRSPFRPCSEKSYKGYDIENGIFIAPWTKSKPGVVDAQLQEIMVPGDIWAGMLARATVAPFWYNQAGNKGVNFALNNLQICGSGSERLDGRKAAKDDFDQVGVVGVDALVDDDIPF